MKSSTFASRGLAEALAERYALLMYIKRLGAQPMPAYLDGQVVQGVLHMGFKSRPDEELAHIQSLHHFL